MSSEQTSCQPEFLVPTAAWQPLVEGADAELAHDAIEAIAQELAQLEPTDASLYHGQAGIALLHGYRARAGDASAVDPAGDALAFAVEGRGEENLPFLARGFTPDSGATWLLPRLVGLARSRQLLMLGRELSGEEAARWGLIHAAVASDAVETEAEALAQRLARGPTVALGLTKWLLAASTDTDLPSQLRNEAFALELSSRSEDFREGLAAFRDKRDPGFGGR